METNAVEIPKPLTETQKVSIRIDRRVEKVLINNPSLSSEQIREILTLANLTKFALFSGNPLCLSFAKELIQITDSLILKEPGV